MSGPAVTVVAGGPVAVVELDRPPANFIDAASLGELATVLEGLAEGTGTRAVVLASAGRHFCAGLDLGAVVDGPPDPAPLYDQALRLFRQPLPVVAAVSGAAIGGGLGLALAADLRVGVPGARLAANFTRLGFHHGFGMTVTLPRVVGPQRALELLCTGRDVRGEEALALGLLDRLVAPEELRSAAVALAGEVAAAAPLAVRSVRATMRGALAEEVARALERERSEQLRLVVTEDWREGVAAAAQRREPRFVGR